MQKQKSFYDAIFNIVIAVIVFLVPSNLFFKFFETESYVNGLRVDYLIPKLYLSDIFILVLLVVWWGKWVLAGSGKKTSRWAGKEIRQLAGQIFSWLSKRKWIVALLALLFIKQFFSGYPISSMAYLLRIAGLGLFAVFLKYGFDDGLENKGADRTVRAKINKALIEKAMLAAMLFQSGVALFQYFYQKTLYGYLLFGEPNLNNYIGIAKSYIFGPERILPYGTTAHPNVLGGFLAIYLLYFFSKINMEPFTKSIAKLLSAKNLVLFLAILALFLTQSISAILTLILGLVLIFCQQIVRKGSAKLNLKKIALITFGLFFLSIISLNLLAKLYPDNPSINRRSYLNTAAVSMISRNITTGVGLNNFTTEVENFSSNGEIVRFVQPVHNIFLLFFAETGLLGTILVGAIIYRHHSLIFGKKIWWIVALLPIALLDHYLLTLNAGLLLLILSLGYFSNQDLNSAQD